MNEGIKNEKNIAEYLNDKAIYELNPHWLSIICEIFQLDDEIIDNWKNERLHVNSVGGQRGKPDICVILKTKHVSLSIKKGDGNSVHQEKTSSFLHFCKNILMMTDDESNCMLLCLYGDGTIDGSGSIVNRMTVSQIKKAYPKEVKIVQSFLDNNTVKILKRALIDGRYGNPNDNHADYAYYGTVEDGVVVKLDENTLKLLSEYHNEPDNKKLWSVGPLTLQIWNRNLNGNPKTEERRHSIQFKWPKLKDDLKKIKEKIDILSVEESSNELLIGNNAHGFENQNEIIVAIDNKKYNQLSGSAKQIIDTMFQKFEIDRNVFINAKKTLQKNSKSKVEISINDYKRFLAIKNGSSNSIHQEKIDTFLEFCKKIGMNEDEINAYKLIHYGDGTIDGKGKHEDRLSDDEMRITYQNEITLVQSFFDRHQNELLERFLLTGKAESSEAVPDAIYYGTTSTGVCAHYNDILNILITYKKSRRALLSVGKLSLQTWNRNLSGNMKNEYKRESIQVKWTSIKRDILEVIDQYNKNKSTFEGDWAEYDLVYQLNKSKNTRLWRYIKKELNLEDLNNIYAVKVTERKLSSLSKKKVQPKADVILIDCKLDHSYLISNNYWLDEGKVKKFFYEKIPQSGISCKIPKSKSFTYCKLTIDSFIKLFGNSYLGAGASLFVKEKDAYLNTEVINAWGLDLDDFIEYFFPNIEDIGTDLTDVKVANEIKSICLEQIKIEIKSSELISNTIFKGEKIFDEPFSASFLYRDGELKGNLIPVDFTVTTGSGRHKGNYTIVIKP